MPDAGLLCGSKQCGSLHLIQNIIMVYISRCNGANMALSWLQRLQKENINPSSEKSCLQCQICNTEVRALEGIVACQELEMKQAGPHYWMTSLH